ncbi:MAG: M23 family metallopeptidase, partial [Clostridia bacterium]|nr:M23 family metallopeptidase [Clostridia bacterium]
AVIDHGAGVFTWYCHLSDFDVREGDAVAKGEAIGKSGNCLLIDGNGVLILCSIRGTFVDPSLILGKEILPTTIS